MSNYHFVNMEVGEIPHLDSSSVLLDGVSVINTVTPVSKLSGKRESIMSILSKVGNDPAKARLIQPLIQELPTVRSMKGTDADRSAVLSKRLETGQPVEDAAFAQVLADTADILFKDIPESRKQAVQKDAIAFDPVDNPDVSKES